MRRRPLTKPRKVASQERARATVHALVDATARILVKEGFDKASTNRIAEVAGVSVGSLYQYYPGKEALVAAVIDRHNRETYALFRAYLENHSDQLRMVDLGLAAFICVTSIEALAHTAVLHRSEVLSDQAVETLVDETTRLVVGYLQSSP
jgi:AcrR family transcriptional regulator